MYRLNLIIIFILFYSCQHRIPQKTNSHTIYSKHVYNSKTEKFEAAFLHIKNGIIEKITRDGEQSNMAIDYDFKDKFIIPGLIDAHTHIFLNDKSFDENFPKELIENSKEDTNERFTMGVQKANAYLKAGFTSIRDLGNSGYFLDKRIKAEYTDNTIPNIYFSGPGICILTCQFHTSASKKEVSTEYKIITSNTDITKTIKFFVENKINVLKVYLDNIPSEGMMGEELFKKIVSIAKKSNLKIAVHAIHKKSINLALKYRVHSIEHAYDFNYSHIKNHDTKNLIMVPTDLGIPEQAKIHRKKIYINDKNIKEEITKHYTKRGTRVKLAHHFSMIIAFGSDYYFSVKDIKNDFINGVYNSIFIFKEYGFSNKEILKFLTVNAAKALNDEHIGSLRSGNTANLLILNENPLQDIHALKTVHSVFLNGFKVVRK